jgi:serine/threonine-protein kinase
MDHTVMRLPMTAELQDTMIIPGDTLVGEKYRILGILGRGGTAVVYEAEHVHLGHTVAIKVLNERPDGSARGRTAYQRMFLEARAAAQLSSEHVVRVFDVSVTASNHPYVVMERLAGNDLARELKGRGSFAIGDAVGLVLQACHALAEAHAAGIVHRDIKPSNLFMTARPDGMAHLKVLDFGQPMLAGSPGYASPEQLGMHLRVDSRADIWSLGIVLFELITGRRPFVATTLADSLLAALSEVPPPLTSSQGPIPPGLESVIRCCLEKEREGRFATIVDLSSALAPFSSAAFAHYPARLRELAANRSAPPVGADDRDRAPLSGWMRNTLEAHALTPPPSGQTTDAEREPAKPLMVAEIVPTHRGSWRIPLAAAALAAAVSAVAAGRLQAGGPTPAGAGAASSTRSGAVASSLGPERMLLAPLPPPAASTSNVESLPKVEASAKPVPSSVAARPAPRSHTPSAPAAPKATPKADPMTYR